MPSTVEATPEQLAKVLGVLQRSMPRGAMIERIGDETGYENEIIWSAIRILEREGKIEGRNPFAYDPNAVDADDDEHGT